MAPPDTTWNLSVCNSCTTMVRCNLVAAPLGCLGRLLLLVTLLFTALAVVESHVGEVDETAMPDKQLGMAVQVCAGRRAWPCACARARRVCVCVCADARATSDSNHSI